MVDMMANLKYGKNKKKPSMINRTCGLLNLRMHQISLLTQNNRICYKTSVTYKQELGIRI